MMAVIKIKLEDKVSPRVKNLIKLIVADKRKPMAIPRRYTPPIVLGEQ